MKKFKRIFAVFFCLLLAAGILGGCGKAASSSAPAPSALQSGNKPLKIVTTIFPEYDWVREILGDKADHAEVTMLLGNGVDLHSYQPTADDIIKISDCDLFLYVGGESDGWVEDALKEATNKNMKVINLLDVLKDTVKTEEAMPGMQAEEGHHHGYSHFADSDVQDRSLSDWDGEWQSVYPYLQEGILDEVMERKAENGNKTAEEYRAYYETGYKTDVSKITINAENNTMCFVKNGVEAKAAYQYKGYQIYDYESGSRGVRYFFEATDGDADAPKYVQFSDHGIAPGKAEHFHIYFGNEGFDALSQEMENWPTYYPMDMSGDEIKEDMLEHAEKEYDENKIVPVEKKAEESEFPEVLGYEDDPLINVVADIEHIFEVTVVGHEKCEGLTYNGTVLTKDLNATLEKVFGSCGISYQIRGKEIILK